MVYPSCLTQNTGFQIEELPPFQQHEKELIGSVNNSQSVAEFMRDWLQIKQTSIRLKTAQDYLRLIVKYITPSFNSTLLSELNTLKLNHFYQHLLKEGVGSRTVRYIHSILRVALKDAIGQGLIASNPTNGAILPRWEKREMMILEEEQITKFLQAANNSPYYGIYHFAIATGMRKGELLGLQWKDVDWVRSILFIRRQAQRVNGYGIIFQEPKTKAGIRKIKIQKNSIEELHQQKLRVEALKQKAKDKWVELDLVFPSRVGTSVVSGNLARNYKSILRRAGLHAIRFHDLRHTAATMMINHEVPITVVSQILGHSKPSVTLDIYSHCSVAMQTQASLVMDGLVRIDHSSEY